MSPSHPILRIAARGGLRFARRRARRALRVRWAARVPLVTLCVGMVVAVLVVGMGRPPERLR